MSSNRSTFKIIAVFLLLALVGTSIYALKLFNDKQETEATLTSEKQAVLDNLSEMSDRYDAAIEDNDSLNVNLIEAKAKVTKLMTALKASQNSVSNLMAYKNQLLQLQDEMEKVLTENKRLKIENTQLSNALDVTKVQLSDRIEFSDSLITQNVELSTIVKDASGIQAAALNGFGVIVRRSGKLKATDRARRADQLRICFTVVQNKMADSGDQELFVQVIDPKNNVLGLNQQTTLENQILNYSLVSRFNYENKDLDICEFVSPDRSGKFEKGTYTVSVFNKNEKVASSQFSLR